VPPLKVFVSYSIRDRKLAKQIKKGLLTYGMNVFLAHDDIEASAQWSSVILATLKESDVFLPLLTEAFSTSEWTDQETGVALAHRKLIIPLKLDRDPYGFVGAIQAQRLNPDEPKPACTRIARIVGKNPELQERFLDGLVQMFADSYSFDEAGRRAEILLGFEGYTPQQARQILLATIENNQIHGSFKARRHVAEIIALYRADLDPQLIKKARQAMR
jgi:hypothetical protein